jgi:outer membrane protein assembly factor BamB
MRHKQYLLILGFIGIALTLSACAGAANTATSWPGLTVDDQYAYVAYQTQVYAVDLNNGNLHWRFPSDPENNQAFYADPTLSQDGQLIVGGYDFVLYSLDAETGTEKWKFDEAENRYIASSLVEAENIFAPAADENLYSLDLNGQLQWTFPSEGESWAKPISDENCECLYLSSMDHTVYAIDPNNGTQKWRSDALGGSVVGTPAYSEDGVLYVGTFGGKLFALNAEDGSVLWEFTTTPVSDRILGIIPTSKSGWIWSSPVLSDGVLYFGDLNGYFYAVDANDGSKLWQLTPEQLDGEIVGSPLVIEDSIYFTSEEGLLYKYDKSENKIWEREVGGKIYTSPKTSNGLILVAPIQIDELLVAYTEDGAQKWDFKPPEN